MNRFFLAGAPVPPDLVEQLGSVLTNGRVLVPYGATEALPVSWTDGWQIQKYKNSTLNGEGSLIGKPVSGADVRIFQMFAHPLEIIPQTIRPFQRKRLERFAYQEKW